MAGGSARPLLPGRPVRIMSELKEIMSGHFKAGGWGLSRPDGVVEADCLVLGSINVFYFVIMGTPRSKRWPGRVSQSKSTKT